jgi:hypothetical protein
MRGSDAQGARGGGGDATTGLAVRRAGHLRTVLRFSLWRIYFRRSGGNTHVHFAPVRVLLN